MDKKRQFYSKPMNKSVDNNAMKTTGSDYLDSLGRIINTQFDPSGMQILHYNKAPDIEVAGSNG